MELNSRGISYEVERSIPILFKGELLPPDLRAFVPSWLKTGYISQRTCDSRWLSSLVSGF